MMKQARQEMGKMSPEEKRMMDSLGLKMPEVNNAHGVTDRQLSRVIEAEDRLVPVKDAARINSISKTPLNPGTLPGYLSTTHNRVAGQLPAEVRTSAEAIYQLVKKETGSGQALANTAAALWMIGRIECALYISGKACSEYPADANNLCNYAALMSMTGAPQLSVPLLEYINRKFPKNSTILNNLGQAWFDLGELTKAGQYLDSAIKIYPVHPQANYTKCFIEQSKGNKQGAIAAIKQSIKGGYTKEKEDELRKLGYKVDGTDIQWSFPKKPDPLGLERFHIPPYPRTVEQCIASAKEWTAFRQECNERIAAINRQQEAAKQIFILENDRRTRQYTTLVQLAMNNPNAPPIPDILPVFANKASIILKQVNADKDGGFSYQLKRSMQRIKDFVDHELPPIRKQYEKAIDSLNTRESRETSEGKAVPDYCPTKKALTNAYLNTVNGTLEQLWSDYFNIQRRFLNEVTYWQQFQMWKDQFDLSTYGIQAEWLNMIQTPHFESITQYTCNTKEQPVTNVPLPDFDEINCQYHSELKLYVGTITTDCNRMDTKLDLKFIKLGLKEDLSKESFLDQFVGCSIEVSEGVDAGKDIGPFKGEVALKGGIRLEFDRHGLQDVVLKGSVKAEVGTDVIGSVKKETDIKTSGGGVGISDLGFGDQSLEVGVKGQISIMSGKSSAESTGILEGVFKR